jgi:RNA polymerase sigma factor for flagellar operon FliA
VTRQANPRGIDLVQRPARVEASLWRRYRLESETDCREQLFNRYVGYARNLAGWLFTKRPPPKPELTDYQQFAYKGLLEAIDGYDPLRGAPFQSFARRRILGSISDGIARMSEISAMLRQRRRVEQERVRSLNQSTDESEKEPLSALSELAVGLAIGLILEGTRLIGTDDDPDPSPSAYDSLEYRQLQARLARVVQTLPEKEEAVIRHHYANGLSFTQIAQLLGLSNGRISQIHRSALERLRKRLGT